MANIAEASRNYRAGDVIVRISEPLVWVTKYDYRMNTCDYCMSAEVKNSAVICVKCRKVFYCSDRCKGLAWNRYHHRECSIFSRRKPMQFENQGIDYMQRLTLRLYLLLTGDDDHQKKESFLLHNGMTRTIEQMECHREQLMDSPQFNGIMNYFKFYQMENDVDRDLLLRCYGILQVNSFGIDYYCGGNERQIQHCGAGLYVEASVFDHSCVPNACASGDGLGLEIRALKNIEPGELIYIDYVQDVLPCPERIKHLSETYFFRCQCERGCRQDLSDPFDFHVDYRRYGILEKLIETLEEKPECQRDWKRLVELSRQRLAIQEQYYHEAGYHPCLSLFYQCFLKLLLQAPIADSLEIDTIREKCRKHLNITHGREHPFYQWWISDSN